MPKLHLKRTPAEEAERAWRKTQRAARKAANKSAQYKRRSSDSDVDDNVEDEQHRQPVGGSKRRKTTPAYADLQPAVDDWEDDDVHYGPQPSSSRTSSSPHRAQDYTYNYESIRASREEARFAEKMADALADDGLYDSTQRLDGVEARMNEYAHIPRRWRGVEAGVFGDEELGEPGLEPWQMNDDEYAEWVRASMWRKKHAAEHEEQKRVRAARSAAKTRAEQVKAETRKLEREMEREREERRERRKRRREEEAWRVYEEQWKGLGAIEGGNEHDTKMLRFEDVPWPMRDRPLAAEDVTPNAISTFLLAAQVPLADGASPPLPSAPRTLARDVLRATTLRYHPDKFDTRILVRVADAERERVRAVAGAVIRVLNELMKDVSDRARGS